MQKEGLSPALLADLRNEEYAVMLRKFDGDMIEAKDTALSVFSGPYGADFSRGP